LGGKDILSARGKKTKRYRNNSMKKYFSREERFPYTWRYAEKEIFWLSALN